MSQWTNGLCYPGKSPVYRFHTQFRNFTHNSAPKSQNCYVICEVILNKSSLTSVWLLRDYFDALS